MPYSTVGTGGHTNAQADTANSSGCVSAQHGYATYPKEHLFSCTSLSLRRFPTSHTDAATLVQFFAQSLYVLFPVPKILKPADPSIPVLLEPRDLGSGMDIDS